MDKKQNRLRRARRTRARIAAQGIHRLCVHRTPRHIYAQIISADGSSVLASASTLDAEVRRSLSYGGNEAAARLVGQVVAERALEKGVERVAFDRSGFRYHGRVKALAEEARERGLKF